MMESQPSPTISFGEMLEDFVCAHLGEPVTAEERFRVARLQWKISILNRDIPDLRLKLPPFSYVNPPDLLLCQEKYWEYQDRCREDGAANKVAAMLISFEQDHPWEWLCCGWKDEAIAALVLGNLGNVKDGRRAAESWLKEYWKRRQKEQRERDAASSPKRRAASKAVSDLETLQFLDEQERWLESIDPALLDPGDELLELFEKRRRGGRPVTYSDYARFVIWLNENRMSLASEKKGAALLAGAVGGFRLKNKTVLTDKVLVETCVAYRIIARSACGAADPYPVVLAVMAKRNEVGSRLVGKVRAKKKVRNNKNKQGSVELHGGKLEFGEVTISAGTGSRWIPDGYQVPKVRRPRKNIPQWAINHDALRSRIVGPAMRRYRIAYLYWGCGWNAREGSLTSWE